MMMNRTIYRVSDGVLNRKHLAYAATLPAFCGRVPKGAQGGDMKWRTMSDPATPLPTGTTLCRQCDNSVLNKTNEEGSDQ
jgi:hypothetical protein